MTLKKGNLSVPQGGQPECPSKRVIYMSLKKDILDVSQKRDFFSMNNLNVLHHVYISCQHVYSVNCACSFLEI